MTTLPTGTGNSVQASTDPLFLANSDHPGARLGTVQFDGSDFGDWSHGVRWALGAKFKLGFVDGKCVRPEEDGEDLARWIRSDYMIRCWIVNSMTKRIASGFRHVSSAKELWDDLCERYEQSNLPLLFKLRRCLANLRQENLSVGDYYGKLKLIWDDIRSIDPIVYCFCAAKKTCQCEISKSLAASDNKNRIIDFLMGLNDCFEAVRGQIPSMDPLPSLNKAFYLVQQIETKKSVSSMPSTGSNTDVSALGVQKHQPRLSNEDYNKQKMERSCEFCKQRGHLMDACFKLHGYPEWYNNNSNSSQSQGKARANAAHQDSPFDCNDTGAQGSSSNINTTLISSI